MTANKDGTNVAAESVTYLRAGRERRATGYVIDRAGPMTKVKPTRDSWHTVWVTREEIAAAGRKPPIRTATPTQAPDKEAPAPPTPEAPQAPQKPNKRPKPEPRPLATARAILAAIANHEGDPVQQAEAWLRKHGWPTHPTP